MDLDFKLIIEYRALRAVHLEKSIEDNSPTIRKRKTKNSETATNEPLLPTNFGRLSNKSEDWTISRVRGATEETMITESSFFCEIYEIWSAYIMIITFQGLVICISNTPIHHISSCTLSTNCSCLY